jgi:hypothetical protein
MSKHRIVWRYVAGASHRVDGSGAVAGQSAPKAFTPLRTRGATDISGVSRTR